MERKLQDAVACFFAESVQKAGRPPAGSSELAPLPPPQQGSLRPGSTERIAALSALAKRQQRRRPHGAQGGADEAPLTKEGRPNRAADQQAGRGRRQRGGQQWSPGPAAAVCYA